ncbi:autotransporter-associated beta strand repeat-containing protein, partial [Achromobacter pulmonis]|uniref:autotransporter-associated beta strand repeat-containing protein n=1 Tax=Achromobacter pulmonis TaxID=1389932 RepID=UPI003C73168F
MPHIVSNKKKKNDKTTSAGAPSSKAGDRAAPPTRPIAPQGPFRLNDTAAALCAALALSAPVAGAVAATGPQQVDLPAQQNPYPVEAVGGLGETGDTAYVFSTPADADPEENQVSVGGRTMLSGGAGKQGPGGDAIQGAGLSLTNDGIVRGGAATGAFSAAGGAGVSGARLIITNNEILQGGDGGDGGAGSNGRVGLPWAGENSAYEAFFNATHGGTGYRGGAGGAGVRGNGLRVLNASDASIEGGAGGMGGAGGNGADAWLNTYTQGGTGGTGGAGGDAITGANIAIINGGDIIKGTGGAGGGGGLGGSGEKLWSRLGANVRAAAGPSDGDGAAIRLTGGVNFLTLEAGSSIDGDIVLSHDDKAFGAPKLSILNRGGASARVTGDVIVGAGADAGFAGKPLTLRGDLTLEDGATLSVAATRALPGEPSETVRARGVTIGAKATFNLSGISAASATDALLFSATEGRIAGDFSDIAIGGKIADRDSADTDLRSANYLTLLRARKSDDGTGYLATYQLGWFDTPPKAHGGFLLGEGEVFTVGTALTPVGASGDWDGNSLTKQGAGTLILSGDNTYTGLTTVDAGTLRVGLNGDTGSVAGDIVNHGHVIFDRSNALTYAGVISGGGALTLAGSGALTLTGANTYTGITTLEAGTLITGVDDALAHSASLTLSRDTVLDLAGHAQTLADGATLKSRGVIRTGGADLRGSALTIIDSGRIEAGDGALVLTGGENTLTFERGAAMTGGVTLDASADAEHPVSLRIISEVAMTVAGALTAGAHSGLTLDGRPLTFTGAATFGPGHALNFTPGLSLTAKSVSFGEGSTVSARITDWDQRPVRLITTTDAAGITGPWRSGEVLLEDAPTPPHAYISADGRNMQYSLRWDGLDDAASGTFRVSGGQALEVAVPLADNTAQTNPGWDGTRLTKQGGGVLILSADNTYSGGTRIEDGTLQLGKGGAAGAVTGDIVNDAELVFDRSGAVAFDGAISGVGSVTKKGANTLTLTGANTYAGKTLIEAGTLRIGDGGTAGSMAASIVNQGTLVFDRSDKLTYAGKISGAGGLIQAGTGATLLTGTNTYGGATEIRAGTLQFGAQDAKPSLNALPGSLSVAKEATLAVDPSALVRVGGEVTLSDGSTLLLRHAALSDDASAAGLTASKVTIGQGVTLRLPNLVDTSAGSKVIFSTTGGIVGDFAGVVMDAPHTADYRDYWTLEARKSADNNSYLTRYGLSWNASPTVAHGTFTLEQGQEDTISQVLLGRQAVNALTKKGAGTLTLTGANTYTGSTAVEGGKLRLGDGGVSGSVNGPISLGEDAALVFERSDAVTYAGVISGAGRVAKKGTNTLTLHGESGAYRGVTTIEGGQLVVGNSGYYGMLTGDIVNEGALVFRHNGYWQGRYGDVISGSGSLLHEGGRLILTGENTYTGGTRLTGFTWPATGISELRIGDNGTTGSVVGNIEIAENTQLSFVRNDDVTYDGVISGAGAVYKGLGLLQGTGMLTLTGDHTYAGGTVIQSGTLRLGDGGTTGSVAGDINFQDVNAALIFDRGDDVTFRGAIYGRGAVTKQGANTLTLTANSTGYVGVTTVAAGTLRLGDG